MLYLSVRTKEQRHQRLISKTFINFFSLLGTSPEKQNYISIGSFEKIK